MMTPTSELTARLSLSLGSRPVADVTLEWVIVRHAAAGGAVLTLRSDGETVPFMTRDVSTARLMRAQKLARENATLLAQGQEISGPDYLLVPLLNGVAQLLGILFIDGPKVVGGSSFMDTYAIVFANCLAVRSLDPSPALANYLGTLTPTSDDREREKLLLSLNRYEWNLSRVARDIGVTRRTIYVWLKKFGIERRRIAKGLPRSKTPQPV
jgi:hypothetical protein